jgi:cell division protein ZapA (FtsZ GTPase activity inhibitor)
MSSTSRYYPETLVNEAQKHLSIDQQVTVKVGEQHFQVNTPDELALAANMVASYHNQYVAQLGSDCYWEEED